MSTNKNDSLAIVLATIAGYLMISAGMFFSIANTGVINNNNIGIENAKFRIQYNLSLQDDSELNQLVINNNLLVNKYSTLTMIYFLISIILGIISLFIAINDRRRNQKELLQLHSSAIS